eukprot:scaffold1091_cov125-Isochrysis_galbana.AAC.5
MASPAASHTKYSGTEMRPSDSSPSVAASGAHRVRRAGCAAGPGAEGEGRGGRENEGRKSGSEKSWK